MGDDQRSFYDAEQGISGTPDGIMYTPDGKIYLLELKSIDPRFNKKNLPKKGHIPQTVQNMHLVETCLGFKLDGGILFYIDASDIWDVREFAVAYDHDLVELSTARADKLWSAVEPDDLEAEGVYSGDCDLCPFTHHCSQSVSLQKLMEEKADVAIPFLVANAEPTPLPIGDQEVIGTFLAARTVAAEMEKTKEAVADTVKKLVMDHGGFVKLDDGTSLIATMSPGRATIDKALLVGRGIDIDEVTKCGKPFVTLNVKEPK